MTMDEAKKAIEMLKDKYEGEENALKALYVMYQKDKISLEDLRAFCGIMGYEFTEEFENMSDEDKKTKGLEEVEEVDKDDEPETDTTDKTEDEADEEDEEDDDDKKAARLFGFDKDKK
jgi:hypothetical protein